MFLLKPCGMHFSLFWFNGITSKITNINQQKWQTEKDGKKAWHKKTTKRSDDHDDGLVPEAISHLSR